MTNPIDTIYGYIQSLTNKRDSIAMTKVMESAYPRRKKVNITAATTLNEATHGLERILTVNSAAGIALTLPASTGNGAIFRFFIGTTITSSSTTIKVDNGSDVMAGVAIVAAEAGDTAVLFETAATTDTITMNGSTLCGIKGDYIELEDVTLNLWSVRFVGQATGSEATIFSATVD